MDELIRQYALLLEAVHDLKARHASQVSAFQETASRIHKIEAVLSKLPSADQLDMIVKGLADVKVILEAKGHSPFGNRGRKVG